jgi:hypothetical protein
VRAGRREGIRGEKVGRGEERREREAGRRRLGFPGRAACGRVRIWGFGPLSGPVSVGFGFFSFF